MEATKMAVLDGDLSRQRQGGPSGVKMVDLSVRYVM